MENNNSYIDESKHWELEILEGYESHRAEVQIVGCQIVPRLRRFVYDIRPLMGTKISDILAKAEDIQFALGLQLFYAYRDGLVIRLVVSEFDVKENRLLKILRSPKFTASEMELPIAFGYDFMGEMHIADLVKLRHLLIAGPSGTGKSVALKCLILSIIVNRTVDETRLIVFEIGSDSLSVFSDVVHLYTPIVKDTETSVLAIESLVAEMEERYALGEKTCQSLPFLIFIVDEFDDTIAGMDEGDSKRFTKALDSLIRRGRKAKIIVVLASHDPTLKTTGINVNGIESRIAFRTLKHQNSSTALGISGAEKLSGDGAMILKACGNVSHLQGSWVTDSEIEQILSTAPAIHGGLKKLETREPDAAYVPTKEATSITAADEFNRKLAEIAIWALGCEKVSAHKIGKRFRTGNRSAAFCDALSSMGIAETLHSKQPRKVLSACFEDLMPETVAFLERYGYTEEQIREAIGNRGDGDV